MPTNRQRHTITEVGAVEEALVRLRSKLGEADLRELVVLGVERKLELEQQRQQGEQRGAELRERLAARSTRPGAVDRAAAAAVREGGWSRALGE